MTDLKNILNYLHGNLSDKEKERFLLKLDSSDELKEEFIFIKRVNDTSVDVNKVELFDEDKEWEKIANRLGEDKQDKGKSRIFRVFSIAASILLFGLLVNHFMTEEPMYKYVEATNTVDTIKLIDGSIVYLEKKSKLKYFVRQDKKTNRRYVELDGNATFDIAHDKNLPFVLKTKDAGIDVLGTIFKIEQVSTGIGVQNIRGLINLFEWNNASNSLILKEGEKAIYTSDGIRKILPKPKKIELLGNYYKVEAVLDYLFEKYETQVSTAPYADVRMQEKIFLNLDQSLKNILQQLDTTSVIKYRKTCKNCYEISILKSK